MAELLAAFVSGRPDEVAITDDFGARTWSELDDRVDRWSRLLRDSGLRPGDRVALLSGNRAEVYEVMLACVHSELLLVPLSWNSGRDELAHVLRDSGSRALLVDPELAALGAALDSDQDRVLNAVLGTHPVEGFAPVEPMLAAVTGGTAPTQASGALLIYTSGTSGQPYGTVNGLWRVGAPLASVAGMLDAVGDRCGIPERGRTLVTGPWYHSAQVFFALFPLLRGCPLTVCAEFEPGRALDVIARDGVTHAHMLPIHFVQLLRLPAATRAAADHSSLRLVWHGGSECPQPVKRQMIDWWGPLLLEYYGATETAVITLIDSEEWLRRPGSVGRAAPGTEVFVADQAGTPLPSGIDGTIYQRRPLQRPFEYHNAPERTVAAYLDDVTCTVGDIGHLDDEGYLYLSGRRDELIVANGVTVYPAEVERVLRGHESVRDVAVFGVDDGEYDRDIAAAVVLERPTDADEAARILGQHCRERLLAAKVPQEFLFMPDLPRDAIGKLSRRALRVALGDRP
ncbi:AMP-binding protein [Kutzneria buriramensis]|uniref:Long-chain acyl-CoA synthetase n=1 Tax=Kutzneria buriramensis TaxID=1045776 RepID=A0A3E0HIH9_9PSEU|nr:AMP-binding protein [Kutzneria buriramensis]REH46160.1 long-chain acyl-CoA synthetase [Kutzneria buriramensis]